MSSFKSPQPSPLGLVLSLARSLGLVSTVDDVVIVPLSQWHTMHERHTADSEALRSALARVVEVEAQLERMAKERATMLTAADAKRLMVDMAQSATDADYPHERGDFENWADVAIATARGQK